ncbi:MAG: ABC transporter permease subunit [Proteobacteria bacterium]|nr:ABC transporter permease subunit [Pseudomonadota bacterium]
MTRMRPGRLLLAGFAALVYAFLQLPLLIVFTISFSSAQYLQFPPPGWSLQWYERYLNSPNWLTPTWLSLKVVVLVVAGLRDFDMNQELAALGLGAGRWRAVWHVTLPQIRPSLVSAAFLAFISSFDELVVAMFLGGANMTLPKKMFDNIRMEIDPTIAAISALQIVLVSALLALAARFGRGGGMPGR